jgi:hypothetical protein
MEKVTRTETKKNESMKQVSTAMITLSMLFLVVGSAGILLDGSGLVGYGFEEIGISMTTFDSVLIMVMSIFLVVVGFILWWYTPEE